MIQRSSLHVVPEKFNFFETLYDPLVWEIQLMEYWLLTKPRETFLWLYFPSCPPRSSDVSVSVVPMCRINTQKVKEPSQFELIDAGMTRLRWSGLLTRPHLLNCCRKTHCLKKKFKMLFADLICFMTFRFNLFVFPVVSCFFLNLLSVFNSVLRGIYVTVF